MLGVSRAAIQAFKCTTAPTARQAKTTRSCGLGAEGALPIVGRWVSRWTSGGGGVDRWWTACGEGPLLRRQPPGGYNGDDRAVSGPPRSSDRDLELERAQIGAESG